MWGAVFALLALAAPSQPDVVVSGRVVRIIGRDTLPVAGARVVLHRVLPARQGPVDSLLSRADGAFSFRFLPDSGAIYLTSARWAGIEYFAPPLTLTSASGPVVLAVADTSSSAPVGLSARHVVVSAPATDGTRAVIELLVIENRGPLTRVAHDSTSPSWQLRLPPDVIRIDVGSSDFANDAVVVRDGTVSVFAALPPGQREITVSYQLPAGLRQWSIPVADSIAAMNVLVEEPTAAVTGPLVARDSQVVSGKRFSRWQGTPAAGARIELHFDFTGTPRWILPALVSLLALLLAGGLMLTRRRTGLSVSPAPVSARPTRSTPELDALLDQVAALDAQFSGGVAAHDEAVWAEYLATRTRLKQEIERHLPG